MKTTIDLPERLVRALKVRAAREGRKMKDVAAEVLERGLGEKPGPRESPRSADAEPFPVIHAQKRGPALVDGMTPQEFSDWIKDALEQEEVEKFETVVGHERLDRAER